MTTSLGFGLAAALALAAGPAPVPRHPLTVDDLLALERVAEPALSPDGRTLAFTVSRAAPDGSRLLASLWTVSADGGEPRRLTHGEEKVRAPCFSPDGARLAFLTGRGGEQRIHQEVLGWIERHLDPSSAPGTDAPSASPARP